MYKNGDREKSKRYSVCFQVKDLFRQGFGETLILKHVKTLHSSVREPKRPQVTPTVKRRRKRKDVFSYVAF